MSTTDDDKTTEQATDAAPEGADSAGANGSQASDTTDAAASDTDENGSEASETGSNASENGNSGASDTTDAAPDGDTFPRAYVEDLRKESAGYRTQVRDLQEQLHRLRVEQTGSLADPADLPFDAAHLESPEALQAAIEDLLAAKPHLKARRFAPGGAGQGPKASAAGGVDLLGILRANA